MNDSSIKKSKQLGMPYGTACNQLRKIILFAVVKGTVNFDSKCFHCGEEIELISEFSIEHIIPWLDADNELFWGLDNIAFSHLSCNVRNKRHHTELQNKKYDNLKVLNSKATSAPIGTKWCSGKCKSYVELANFTKNKYKTDGYASECKQCVKR